MSKGKGRNEENALRAAATASAAEAAKPDPFEERQRAHVTRLDQWRNGELGPIDVRNMPGGGVGMSLFRDAKTARDQGRVGRGLLTMSDGANPNFTASLDKEMGLERDLAASGQLEGYVEDTMNGVDERMTGLAGIANARRMRLADMAQNNYQNYLSRPKQPSFLRQLATGALGSLGTALSAV